MHLHDDINSECNSRKRTTYVAENICSQFKETRSMVTQNLKQLNYEYVIYIF
jgi:hypothetical protein